MDEHDYRRFSLTHSYDIPHYYGDYVRQFLLGAAAVSLISVPLFGDLLPFGTLAQVTAAIILVALAGLTNPHGKVVMWLTMLCSGLGILLLESAAINLYSVQPITLFAAREVDALLLVGAFYFSVKTVRAMSMRQVGHPFTVGEFDEDKK
jgi:hypothetical protein